MEELKEFTDNFICGICKGKKFVLLENGKPAVCPKCNGSGKLLLEIENNKKQLLFG